MEEKEMVGGYLMCKADTYEETVEIAKGCPILEFENGIVEVREVQEMKTAEGPFPMETTYTWDKINDNTTRMTLRNCGQPSGFSKLFAPFMGIMMRKANQLERACD